MWYWEFYSPCQRADSPPPLPSCERWTDREGGQMKRWADLCTWVQVGLKWRRAVATRCWRYHLCWPEVLKMVPVICLVMLLPEGEVCVLSSLRYSSEGTRHLSVQWFTRRRAAMPRSSWMIWWRIIPVRCGLWRTRTAFWTSPCRSPSRRSKTWWVWTRPLWVSYSTATKSYMKPAQCPSFSGPKDELGGALCMIDRPPAVCTGPTVTQLAQFSRPGSVLRVQRISGRHVSECCWYKISLVYQVCQSRPDNE